MFQHDALQRLVMVVTLLVCLGIQYTVMLLVALPSMAVFAATGTAKLEVVDASVPASDSGRFDFKIDGTKFASNVGDGGTTATQTVTGSASHVVLEQANSSTSATALANYTTTVTCKDQHGAGATLGSSSPTGTSSRQLTVTIPTDSDVVCIFSNTRQTGTFAITNVVVNDSGGTAQTDDFGLSLGSISLSSGQAATVPAGTYALNESGVAGYDMVGIAGANCPTQLGGSIILAKAQVINCTITHDDRPAQIKVVPTVGNADGGQAQPTDFQLSLNGNAAEQNQYLIVNPGTYSVSEVGPVGYAQAEPSCVEDITLQLVSYPVALQLGQSVTCTIANDDITPGVTIITQVVSSHGGLATAQDFSAHIDATSPSTVSLAGSAGGTSVTLHAGNYAISESAPNGYAVQYSSACVGLINIGEQATCTITNRDIAPTLTVVNAVINDDGSVLQASDFLLSVDQTTVLGNTANPFDAGLHMVRVAPHDGYLASSWSGDCAPDGSITLVLGGSYTCLVTNDDVAATIAIVPHFINNNGGSATEADAPSQLDSAEVHWSEPLPARVGSHIVSAAAPAGYAASSWSGDCAADGTILLISGQGTTCDITFDDIAPILTANAFVTNDSGGELLADKFLTYVDAVPVAGTTTLSAGDHLVTSTSQPGYSSLGWTGDCSADGHIHMQVGGRYTCNITHNDRPARLTIYNQVDPATSVVFDFHSLELGDFTLTGDDTMDGTSVFDNLASGVYVIQSLAPQGWTDASVTCTNDTYGATGGQLSITLALGADTACTFSRTVTPATLPDDSPPPDNPHPGDNDSEPTRTPQSEKVAPATLIGTATINKQRSGSILGSSSVSASSTTPPPSVQHDWTALGFVLSAAAIALLMLLLRKRRRSHHLTD